MVVPLRVDRANIDGGDKPEAVPMIVAGVVDRPIGPRELCVERCPHHGTYRWYRRIGSDRVADCPTCRLEQNQRERERRRRWRSVRTPPRPPHERTAGACSLCGTSPLPPRRRAWCSDDCVELWYVATSSRTALAWLVAEFGRRCWRCDAQVEPGRPWGFGPEGPPLPRPVELFVDHVRPLWSLTEAERGELRWWLPFNLQLLCGPCHGAKTSAEAGERAALRRAPVDGGT